MILAFSQKKIKKKLFGFKRLKKKKTMETFDSFTFCILQQKEIHQVWNNNMKMSKC